MVLTTTAHRNAARPSGLGMHDVFDRLENRTAASREGALLRDLQHVLTVSKSRAPALRAQLRGIDIAKLRTRADLPRIPLQRHSDLLAAQADLPPFGGFVATRVAGLAHVFGDSGAMATPAGQAKDWWGMARALYAAGLRKGALVCNTFPYDLMPHGHMADAGARAIGCPVLPAGGAEPKRIVEAVARFRPSFFCGAAERLRQVLDNGLDAAADLTSLKAALVTGALKFGLRRELELRGLAVRHAFLLPEVGLVAYESGSTEGMTLCEQLLLEIVDEAGAPVEPGAEGEMVLTRINLDYPILRYATGVTARVLSQPSTCGRTNTRVAIAGDAAASTETRHIHEIRARHPDLRMQLSFAGGTPHLRVEHRHDEPDLRAFLGETLAAVTRCSGVVEIVRPGTLPDDDSAGTPAPH